MSTRILPVIHHRDDNTSFVNAAMAEEAGCAGVVLIEMEGRDEKLDGPAVAIKSMFPDLLVFTNRLFMPPETAIERDHALGLDGTWIDNPGVSSRGRSEVTDTIVSALDQVKRSKPDFLFFGSVAFKTQGHEPDPAEAARAAARLDWVVTTSGPATGVAPDIEKLRLMKAAIGDAPLAVASGVSPENAHLIAPHVDWVLVSTGISRDFHTFDHERLFDLMAIINPAKEPA